jgi:adenylosuccinate lyase
MPHKRNPVLSENLTGLSRLVRSAVTPALENVALWHERDISHSAAERVFAPDSCMALDFSLHRLAGVIENLLVYPERMRANLERTGGLVFSQRVLLALTQNGFSREDAYRIVQRSAMKVWESDGKISLRSLLEQDSEVTGKLDKASFEAIFDYAPYIKNAGLIIERALLLLPQ